MALPSPIKKQMWLKPNINCYILFPDLKVGAVEILMIYTFAKLSRIL
jgi:hypothetical protein